MSPTLATLFAESGHPSIPLSALIPRPPLEMMFSQGEKVAVLSSWERGIVEAVHRDHVEVRLSGGASTMNIPEEELHKDLVISDFIQVLLREQKGKTGWVEKIDGDTTHVTYKNQGMMKMLQWEAVLVISEDHETFTLLCNLDRDLTIGELMRAESGPYRGQMGWVVKVTSDAVHILQEALDIMEVEQLYYCIDLCSHYLQSFVVPVNWVCVTTPSWQHSQPSSTEDPKLMVKYRDRDHVPWIGTPVIVIKEKHPFRTYPAMVTDVLCGQEMLSGLKLMIQLTCFDPTTPCKRLTLDYDDVVEQRFASNTYAP